MYALTEDLASVEGAFAKDCLVIEAKGQVSNPDQTQKGLGKDMWEIVCWEGCHVYADRSMVSSHLGHKGYNKMVYGREVGDWLALIEEPGYIKMRQFVRPFVRQMNHLIITLHVGQLGSNGCAEALCTCMSGEELAEVQVSPTDPVGDVRAKIEAQLFNGNFEVILPNGRVLSDNSVLMVDVLGESWALEIDEGDLIVEEIMI